MYQDDNIQNVHEEVLNENKRLKKEINLLIKLIEECGLKERSNRYKNECKKEKIVFTG